MPSRSYNILYLSSFGDFRGGGQISLFHLVRNTDKFLFHPHVILPSNGTLAVKLQEQNIDVSFLNFVKVSPKNVFKNLILLSDLFKLIGNQNIDLIHTDGPRNTFYAGLVAKIKKVPLVFHVRANNKDRYDRILYCLSSKIILVADALKSRFDWVNKNRKFITIYNGIDLSEFVNGKKIGYIRKEYEIGKEDLVITFTGRIERLKGQRYLIDACGRLREALKNFYVLLVGKISDLSYFEECKQRAVELGIQDKVIFTGHKDTVSHILADTDIFVSPSLFEAFPRSVLEAMGAGKPVILTDVGGCPEAVEEGISGFVVKAKDSTSLGDRITRLAKDPKMRKGMGDSAKMRAEMMFGIDQNVRETERVYKDLLGIE